MNKLFEYMTLITAVLGTLMLVGATGAVETDQWLLAGTLSLLGVTMYILSLYSQTLYKESK